MPCLAGVNDKPGGCAKKMPASRGWGPPLAGYERIEIESETPRAGRGFRTHVPDPLGATLGREESVSGIPPEPSEHLL